MTYELTAKPCSSHTIVVDCSHFGGLVRVYVRIGRDCRVSVFVYASTIVWVWDCACATLRAVGGTYALVVRESVPQSLVEVEFGTIGALCALCRLS